jgi:hypothetical protein
MNREVLGYAYIYQLINRLHYVTNIILQECVGLQKYT